LKSVVNESKPTYAEKVKLLKNEPLVIVKPKNSKKTGKDTREDVKKKIDPSVIPVKELRNIAGSGVGLECYNGEETENVSKTVEERMGKDYEVTVAELRNPEVKIVGLAEEPVETEIVNKMKRQNDFIAEDAIIEILKIEKAKNRTQTHNLALKVDPKTFNAMMEAGKVNIGWSRCRVIENVRILRYFKCAEYGHKISECEKNDACDKCAGSHHTKDCTSNQYKCVNCTKAQIRFDLSDIKTDHPAWSRDCQVYQRILAKRKKTINYYG